MAKFFGPVGFATYVETAPGVYREKIVERNYYGDVLRDTTNVQSTNQVNDELNVGSEISILADQYAHDNPHSIRYVEFMGAAWKVKSFRPQYPRLILTLGGVFNGQQT